MKNRKVWDTGLTILNSTTCPHMKPKEKPEIVMPYHIWAQALALTKAIDTEWSGYLDAERDETNTWLITGLTIPKQEVTGSHFEPKETLPACGVIHSHVDMAATFSPNDVEHINSNHDFSIVVNKKEETSAVVRRKLPCGAFGLIVADVVIEYPVVEDIDAFVEASKQKIDVNKQKSAIVVVNSTSPTQNCRNKYRGWDLNDEWTYD